MTGTVALDRPDVVRRGQSTVGEHQHDAEITSVVGDLRRTAEHAQDVLERAAQHDAAREAVTLRLSPADLVHECAARILGRRAINGRHDERYAVLGENNDERGKLGVESILGDEGAQVRGRLSASSRWPEPVVGSR